MHKDLSFFSRGQKYSNNTMVFVNLVMNIPNKKEVSSRGLKFIDDIILLRYINLNL